MEVGDEVWVKPAVIRCTSQWGRGVVTKVNSTNNVEVGEMPCHILDLWKVVQPIEDATGNLEGAVEASTDQEGGEVDVRRNH